MDTLRIGSTGPQVELLQAALSRAGYDTGAPDGIFGTNTQRAVRLFQQNNGLMADGVFGPATYRALYPYLTGYMMHQIESGDTLFRLSAIYGTTVQAIETANPGINPASLTIGQTIAVPLSFPVVFTNISFTYRVLQLCIEGLARRYPFLTTGSIGSSVMGKDLTYIAIGDGENEVFYNASHHANEWLTTPVLMKFLEEYAASFSQGGRIFDILASELYERTTLYLVPMVDPDGVDLVTGEIKEGSPEYARALAMNYPPVDFPSGWKANIRGVDLNLNYPAEWKTAREIKFAQGYVSPGPRDYVGPYPLSEPESQAVALFTLQHHFRLILAYHSQGQVIFWKYLDFMPPQSYEIAQIFSAVSGYALLETPEYSAYAGYKDWFIQTYNLPGYTIEVGQGQNPLPISQFDQIYSENIGILALGAMV